MVYVEQQRVLGPDDRVTQETKILLDQLTFDDDHSHECSSQSPWRPFSINIQRRPFDSDNDFAYLDPLHRRHSTAF